MMSEPALLYVWGAGGHGRMVAELCALAGYRIGGWVDRTPDAVRAAGGLAMTIPLLSEAEFLDRLARGQAGCSGVALGLGDNGARFSAMGRLPAALLPPAVVHPSAVLSPTAGLAPGAVVFALAAVNAGAVVQRGVVVNTGAIVEHDCVLEVACHVAPGAVLGGGVHLGARALVGTGAIVLPGIRIGDDAVVGAGAVVTADVAASIVVVGIPARPSPTRPHA